MGPSGIREDPRIAILIPFADDKDSLLPEAKNMLRELGSALKRIVTADPSAAFLVEGHTDMQESDAYDLDLSIRRAQRVVEALVADYALSADHLQIKGFGKTRPINLGTSDADRARNRRVEVVRLNGNEGNAYLPIKPVSISPPVPEVSALQIEVRMFYQDSESRSQELQDGATLHSGVGYRLFFEAKQSCYVDIFQVDSSGKLFHLYPNPETGSRDNFAQAQAEYWAPGPQQWFTLDTIPGEEQIYVLASKERLPDLEAVLRRFMDAGQGGAESFTLGIKPMGVSRIREEKKTATPIRLPADQLARG